MTTVVPIVGWGPIQLDVTTIVLFTSPTAGTTVINRAVFTNVDTVSHTITVYVVRAAGSADATTTVIYNYVIQPGEAYVAPELASLVLKNGDTVQASANSAAVITTVGSGFSV